MVARRCRLTRQTLCAALPVGLPALPPSQPNLVMNPLMANVLGGLSAEDVPFQEGWLKLRGIPFSVTKTDIIAFFAARRHHVSI